jgi:hypothetical protein
MPIEPCKRSDGGSVGLTIGARVTAAAASTDFGFGSVN